MKHDAHDWISAWALAAIVVGAIALADHPITPHNASLHGYDIARTRNLAAHPADPRLLVDRDEPLVEPGEPTAADEATTPDEASPVRPIC